MIISEKIQNEFAVEYDDGQCLARGDGGGGDLTHAL